MHDPSMQEESVTLLGEEGLRSGGQALKLGYVLRFFKYAYIINLIKVCELHI